MKKHLILLCGVVIASGCTTISGNTSNVPEWEKTVQDFIQKNNELAEKESITSEDIEEIKTLTHSESPYPELLEMQTENNPGEIRITKYSSVNTEVVGENLGEQEIRERTSLDEVFEDGLLQEVAGTNYLVKATDSEKDLEEQYLVVKENGEWVILF